jgi:23S rRNA (guanine745-N1)-methyltransferase
VLADVVDLLACPVCGSTCALDGATVRCADGHAFDVARQGYVNLLPGRAGAGTADTPAMVAARATFLDAGHFAPLTRRLVAAVTDAIGPDAAALGGAVLDLGAGTGHHLAAVLEALPAASGLALDLSKHAMRRAARAHARIGAAVCDAWGVVPVRDDAIAVALDVFAPRNAAELARVLAPDGVLVVVTPTADHLGPLVARLGLLTVDVDKAVRVDRQLAPMFVPVAVAEHRHTMRLDAGDVRAVVGMGPSAWHVEPAVLDAGIAALPAELEVAAAVRIATYRRAG